MSTAIGVVMTSRIVTGRLEDQRLTGKLLHYPEDPELMNELDAIPGSELVEILAEHILALAGETSGRGGLGRPTRSALQYQESCVQGSLKSRQI